MLLERGSKLFPELHYHDWDVIKLRIHFGPCSFIKYIVLSLLHEPVFVSTKTAPVWRVHLVRVHVHLCLYASATVVNHAPACQITASYMYRVNIPLHPSHSSLQASTEAYRFVLNFPMRKSLKLKQQLLCNKLQTAPQGPRKMTASTTLYN